MDGRKRELRRGGERVQLRVRFASARSLVVLWTRLFSLSIFFSSGGCETREFVLPLFLFFLSCAGHRVRHSLLHATQDNIISDFLANAAAAFFFVFRVELKRPNKNFRSGRKTKKRPGPDLD